jgi:hypothetical protein
MPNVPRRTAVRVWAPYTAVPVRMGRTMVQRLARRFTVTFTVQVTVDEITPAVIRRSLGYFNADEATLAEPETVADIARQRALLEAVVAEPAVLERLLKEQVARGLTALGERDIYEVVAGSEVALQEVLAPALARLEAEDRAVFARAVDDEAFAEETTVFDACFQATLEDCVVEELPAADNAAE